MRKVLTVHASRITPVVTSANFGLTIPWLLEPTRYFQSKRAEVVVTPARVVGYAWRDDPAARR